MFDNAKNTSKDLAKSKTLSTFVLRTSREYTTTNYILVSSSKQFGRGLVALLHPCSRGWFAKLRGCALSLYPYLKLLTYNANQRQKQHFGTRCRICTSIRPAYQSSDGRTSKSQHFKTAHAGAVPALRSIGTLSMVCFGHRRSIRLHDRIDGSARRSRKNLPEPISLCRSWKQSAKAACRGTIVPALHRIGSFFSRTKKSLFMSNSSRWTSLNGSLRPYVSFSLA